MGYLLLRIILINFICIRYKLDGIMKLVKNKVILRNFLSNFIQNVHVQFRPFRNIIICEYSMLRIISY